MELVKSFRKSREYQTVRLFAILAMLTMVTVLFFKVVLFAPQGFGVERVPARELDAKRDLLNIKPETLKQSTK